MATAEQIHDNYARRVDAIRGRRELSDHARRVALARAHRDTQNALTELHDQALADVAHERTRLERKIFGNTGTTDPAAAISRRDAADRAAGLTDPRAAAQLLARAERSRDEHLAQAVAAHAAENGWGDILTSYTATRPAAAQALDELSSLPNPDDLQLNFMRLVAHQAPTPPELGTLSAWQIAQLADTDEYGDLA
ncbi:hypothetical protein [Yinghuangia seranimata]|uniref:hypothetical protein n=1 Tax=Yinghuangia seranimata TaxID=408067 RepID=UPI00248B5470|nr:hypothetical protein [Yinghuangia seranimata]MDI2127950.1 hypothetical protein [Yinghuangia seranimata]